MVEETYHLVVQLSKNMKDFELKEFLKPLLNSMRNFNEYNVRKSLELLFSDSVNIKMCHHFGILSYHLFKNILGAPSKQIEIVDQS